MKRAAKMGDIAAMTALGTYYFYGIGVERNARLAARWYRLAAEKGDLDAQYNLAASYAEGNGIRRSYKDALKWLELPTRYRMPEALYMMGQFYLFGQGVKKQPRRGFLFEVRASERGLAAAMFSAGHCLSQGIGTRANFKKALTW
jgi:TPR repeat protein